MSGKGDLAVRIGYRAAHSTGEAPWCAGSASESLSAILMAFNGECLNERQQCA
jgi:hypothetical protein